MMDAAPQPNQAPPQPLLRMKFDNVSLLFLIIVLIGILTFSKKLGFADELVSWLMQTATVVVGAYIGLTQGNARQPWSATPGTAAIDIKPGEKALVNNTTPPVTTTKI
jgi:hypothetical protein